MNEMNFQKSLLLLNFLAFAIILSSCTKKDGTPPYMRLIGTSDTSIVLNSEFIDPGAFAKDETDGLLPVEISGLLNTDSIGIYTRSYIARDKEDNTTELTRTIRVQSEVSVWGGTYNVDQFCNVGGSIEYTDPVRPSNSKNTKILLNLGNYATSYNIEGEINELDSSITVNFQSRLTNQVPIKELQFFSTFGRLTSTGFIINYNLVEVDTSGSQQTNQCSVTYQR